MLHHWSGGRGRTRRPSGPRPFLRHRSHLRCGRAQARHQKAAGRPHQPLCRGRRSAEGQALMSEAVIPPAPKVDPETLAIRSEEHTSELQSLMRISYAVFCLKKKNKKQISKLIKKKKNKTQK